MAKKGQTVDELYLRLGLDISTLSSDFIAADETINKNLSALNRAKNNIKLKAELDTASMDAATDKVKILKVQEESLTKIIDLQRNRVNLVNVAYQDMVRQQGANSIASQKLQTNLLREQTELAKLEAELKKVNSTSINVNTNTNTNKNNPLQAYSDMKGKMAEAASSVANFTSSTDGAIMESLSLIARVPTAYGKAAAAVVALTVALPVAETAIVKLAQPAVNAGNNIHQLAQRMHTTNEQAAEFSKMFKLAGVDVNAAATGLMRLDKQIMQADASGNAATKMLNKFGVSLQDSNGNLLPYNQQLEALAQGYERAAKAGKEEEFEVEIFGARMPELIQVLREYNELKEDASKLSSTSLISPEEAHQVEREIRIMDYEMTQLKLAFSAALIPVAKEIMPDLIEKFKDGVEWIKENKEGIKIFGQAAGTVLTAMARDIGSVIALLAKLASAMDENSYIMSQNKLAGVMSILGKGGLIGEGIEAYYKKDFEAYKQAQENKKALGAEATKAAEVNAEAFAKMINNNAELQASEAELASSKEAATKNMADADKINYDLTHNAIESQLHDIEVWKDAESKKAKTAEEKESIIRLAAAKTAQVIKELAKLNQEVSDEIYTLTHNALDNAIYAAEKQAKSYRDRGADETLVLQLENAKKAKIMEDFSTNVLAKVNSSYESAFQNRLDEIDREKKAWINKGLAEVEATQWAENEKQKITQQTAVNMLKEQREYLMIYRKAMAGNGSLEEKMAIAQAGMAALLRKKAGISDGDFTTLAEMRGFNQAYTQAQQNIVPIMPDYYTPDYDRTVKAIRGTNDISETTFHAGQSVTSPNYQVTVNIGNAVTQDSASMNKLADTVADKIHVQLNNRLGGGNNGY